jgi:glycosyltransferase involved in cell wall biosynthesis
MKNGQGKPPVYHQFLVSRDLGGAGLVALHLAKFLAARGWEAPVWVPGKGAAWSEAERLRLTVQTFDLLSASSPSALQAAKANWGIWRGLSRGAPGLVHVHSPGAYGALRHGLGLSGLRRVAHVQIEEEPGLLRWAFKSPPDLIITCARFLVDQVRRVLPEAVRERQRIAAVPNAVDIARFSPADKGEAKRKVGAPAGVPLAVMLANLAPHKGQETAIKAAALLKARGAEAHFWLAGVERGGAGAYTARLQALVGEMGVADRVRLLGPRSDAPDLLRAADLFLLPSTCEGLPLSVLEAQATKVPVLAAPTAGVPEVVRDGETGFLIAADDAAGYAGCIEHLMSHPDLRGKVTEAAYDRVTREHNWSAYCQRVWDLYQEELHGPTASRGGWSCLRANHRRRPVGMAD